MVIGAEGKKAETSEGASQLNTIIAPAPTTAIVTGGNRSLANATNNAMIKPKPNTG